MDIKSSERKLFITACAITGFVLTIAIVRSVRSTGHISLISIFLTPDQHGQRLFQLRQYNKAAEIYINPQWQATALYRDGQFKPAAGIYAGIGSAEGNFNLANALVMQGKYEEAIKKYDRALTMRPNWEDAEINRRIAGGRAERIKKEGGDMTGGMLGADEIVFDKSQKQGAQDTETVEGSQVLSDAELRAAWLRRVQTKPADFLRAKFAYQYSMKEESQK